MAKFAFYVSSRRKYRHVLELIQVSAYINSEKTFKRESVALIKGSRDLKCTNLTLLTLGDTKIHDMESVRINEINIIEWLIQ